MLEIDRKLFGIDTPVVYPPLVDAIKHETKSRARKKGTKNAAAAAAKNPADAVDTNESPSPVRADSNND